MSDTANIAFAINTTNADAKLGIEIWIDTDCVYQTNHVTTSQHFSHSINDDDEAEHELRIVMLGKNQQHTVVDDQGNITKDAWITITNPTIDKIEVAQLFNEKTVYTHDFNGTQPESQHQFYGVMGCNGTVSLRFSTPIYLWLLENM
jgi:hypothetical protein